MAYANDTLCHVWASGNKTAGKSHNGSLWFDGPALYSYGRHCCAGYIMPENVALLNNTSRSVTTSRHCTSAYRAVTHMTRHYVPELEDIVGALDAIRAGTVEDYQRAAIARHVEKHITGIDAPAGAYVLKLAGKRNPSQTYLAMRQRAARAAIKRKALDDKRAKQAALETAARLASYTPADIAATVQRASERYNAIHELKQLGTIARRAHKAAKQAGHTTRAAKVWIYIKALDEKRRTLEKRAAYRASNATLSNCIERLRAAWPNYERGQSESWELSRIAEWAEYVANNGKGLRPAGKAALRNIASNARQIAADKQAAIAAERYARESEKRADWLNGGASYWRGTDETGGALIRALRVERDATGAIIGGTLETSQGANVPLTHALRVFAIARQCREAGRTLEPRQRVGLFTVDRIDSTGGFNAGCHRINWPEIERLAIALEVYP